jgi:hypothetical protein
VRRTGESLELMHLRKRRKRKLLEDRAAKAEQEMYVMRNRMYRERTKLAKARTKWKDYSQ